ncbi:B-box type zinc finger protein ncl-1-like isoform X2 [Zootermopsis nevadensis]|uniref:B-box type zinc finger protein ncl-1-like isoform X2 n=1 Tax=Zootermopsis nevadensis TaxID=136037 RepID=UPI000B8EA36F|nr:B-box type zinc finger protein ncl-1-like isoform X2 [Zootermopsis nevadensis]
MEMDSSDENELGLFGDGFGGSSPGPLEESSPSENQDKICNICSEKYSSPRVLSCLHVFCESCLEKMLMDGTGESGKRDNIIKCPNCKQETKVGSKGAGSLPCDHVLVNILDMSAIESMAVLCTSCKAKEKAVARCSDCANFLCPNCNTAHQFMRCFENHHVLAFEELRNSHEVIPIHKPIFCENHPAENMKFFCLSCQVPVCNDCLLKEHKAPEHLYERLSEAEDRQREELQSLMTESKSKVEFCEDASSHLANALSELQVQHDCAKDLIQETFQSYKAVLEKCRDKTLEDLQKLHSKRELKIMDTFHSVEKTMEKINDACKFTSRLLEYGNTVEVLSLKGVVGAQLLHLINNTPKPEVNTSIEFETDIIKFEAAVKATFGTFHTDTVSTPKETTPSPTLPGVQPLNLSGILSAAGIGIANGCPSTVTSTSSPVSLPASMQSSFEGELASGVGPAFSLPPGVIGPTEVPPVQPTLPPTSLHGLTSIQEYNLQQLASLAEKEAASSPVVGVPPSHPAPSSNPSPTPSFTLADLFSGDISSTSNALNNLQALAKLGSVSLNNQDLANGSLNGGPPGGGSLVLGRDPSPSLEINTSMTPLNGASFQSLSGSPSPILSQPDELLGDNLHNIPVIVGGGGPAGSFHHPRAATGKLTPMQIRCKYGQLGPSKGQFNSPHGFCLGAEEDIIVADTNNHRIQVFEKTGTFKFQFGIPGKEEGQLWYPRKVAVMRNTGKFVVCDRGNERSRMQIFTKNGHFIKKIAIRYIDIVAGLAVTSQGHIVAVDSVSPTVFVISEGGDLLRWFDCSDYMREPSDIAISGKEYFVCDFKGHCVVVFNEEGQFLRRIGCESITNFPNGIDISDAGDVLVGDSHGNRFHVAVFSRDGSLLSEFECPYVKVSRCCGLKITSEGYVVTLAKNNHHVLVLNTLYIM